ncbi:MAG: M20 family metallopeptidase [bacterium]
MKKPANNFQVPQKLQACFSKELQAKLLSLRWDLHQHPELAFQEHRTAQKLYQALASVRPAELDRVAGTGVVARIKGANASAPTVAVRGDMDALPIQEATGLEYASLNAGVMHACGHDVHGTWTVGAAHLLAQRPAHGDVLIVLQPAEEIGKGAQAILETGALDDMAAIFAAHVDRRFAVGQVVAQEGPVAASADTFEIELLGQGAHGARPHESADPIVGAAALVNALQTIVSRRLNPASPAVVTVGTVNAGSAPNIIPERATLSGTVRAVDSTTRRLLQEEVRRIAEATAALHRLQAKVKIEEGTPPIVNKAGPVSWARRAVTALLGEQALVPLGFLNLGGEDFAFYSEKTPGCFLRIGARELGGAIVPAHSPAFYAADGSLFIGAAVLAQTARVASAALAGEKA